MSQAHTFQKVVELVEKGRNIRFLPRNLACVQRDMVFLTGLYKVGPYLS